MVEIEHDAQVCPLHATDDLTSLGERGQKIAGIVAQIVVSMRSATPNGAQRSAAFLRLAMKVLIAAVQLASGRRRRQATGAVCRRRRAHKPRSRIWSRCSR